ncbi:MAG: 5'/3'-nucleotidase SurE [Planctomycetes bacterium]|nr:5'/3'-nucleotidase SurE [Planctomycetota bacterium]
MHFLLTNDDGIDAEGIAALAEAAAPLGELTWVAPHVHLSGCSHQVTTHQPVRVTLQHPGRYAVEGTPADCVRVGLAHLVPAADWVLSGVNHGGNLGVDVHISGTVAAVREAVLHGKPGIALSHYKRREQAIDWHRAVPWLTSVLAELLAQPWQPRTFWNVNLPQLDASNSDPKLVYCALEPGPLPLSFREEAGAYLYNGNYHQRVRRPGSDVDVCFGGNIAATRIQVH